MPRKWLTQRATMDGGVVKIIPEKHQGYALIRDSSINNIILYLCNSRFEEAILLDIEFPELDSSEFLRLQNQVRSMLFHHPKIYYYLEDMPDKYSQIFKYFIPITLEKALEKIKEGETNE